MKFHYLSTTILVPIANQLHSATPVGSTGMRGFSRTAVSVRSFQECLRVAAFSACTRSSSPHVAFLHSLNCCHVSLPASNSSPLLLFSNSINSNFFFILIVYTKWHPFPPGTTQIGFSPGEYTRFLREYGVHGFGFWRRECSCAECSEKYAELRFGV